MSTIVLKFLDDQTEKELTVDTTLTIKEVLERYLRETNSYVTLDPNIYVFQMGYKVLNKPNNINKTVEELGLSSDNEIKFTRKKDRNYA